MIPIILASKSSIRKQMLEKENIPFEVMVSNADESPNLSKSFEEQLADISMRKAQVVFEQTVDRGPRIIVAADQNIVFENVMYESQRLWRKPEISFNLCKGIMIFTPMLEMHSFMQMVIKSSK